MSGSNLSGATAVAFGGTAAASFTVLSSTSISAISPMHAPGVVDVTVATPDGTSNRTASDQFTFTSGTPAPTVTSVSPNSGPISGGTGVTVTGTNFVSGTAISFGGTTATGVTFGSSTYLTCVTPAHAAEAVDVRVTNPDQQSAILGGGFTYVGTGCALACSASVPTTGLAGTSVPFQGYATPTACTGQPSYLWTFGDGSTSAEQDSSHAYAVPGNFSWSLTATLQQAICNTYGSISVAPAVPPPQVGAVVAVSNPFRLKIFGYNFHPGCTVKIDGSPVPSTKYKRGSLAVAKSSAALKAIVPVGVQVQVTVTNNDDGGVSAPFPYTR